MIILVNLLIDQIHKYLDSKFNNNVEIQEADKNNIKYFKLPFIGAMFAPLVNYHQFCIKRCHLNYNPLSYTNLFVMGVVPCI